jgi:hypothetical protein
VLEADGVLATQGGRFGGWSLLILDGKPMFAYAYTNQDGAKYQNKGRTRLVVPALRRSRQARGVYATARPLLRPAAHEDTLNLGPSKIEADPQPVLAGRPGYVLPVSLRIASIMMPVERWTSRQTIFRSIPSCAPSNGKTNMSPIRIIRP